MDLTKKKTAAGYEVITIGNYNLSDITWRVLDEDDEKMLVICEKVLDFAPMKYDNLCSEETCVWKNTALCSRLNQDFIEDEYLEEDELEYIIPDDDGEVMFLLTKEELKKFFPTPKDRQAKEYTNLFGSGCYDDFFDEFDADDGIIYEHELTEERYLPYWTSSMYCNDGEGYAYIVGTHGEIDRELCSQICGIRPAMWIKKVK